MIRYGTLPTIDFNGQVCISIDYAFDAEEKLINDPEIIGYTTGGSIDIYRIYITSYDISDFNEVIRSYMTVQFYTYNPKFYVIYGTFLHANDLFFEPLVSINRKEPIINVLF